MFGSYSIHIAALGLRCTIYALPPPTLPPNSSPFPNLAVSVLVPLDVLPSSPGRGLITRIVYYAISLTSSNRRALSRVPVPALFNATTRSDVALMHGTITQASTPGCLILMPSPPRAWPGGPKEYSPRRTSVGEALAGLWIIALVVVFNPGAENAWLGYYAGVPSSPVTGGSSAAGPMFLKPTIAFGAPSYRPLPRRKPPDGSLG